MAILIYEPKELREKRDKLRRQNLDRDAFMAAYKEEKYTSPEPVDGPIELFSVTDKEGGNHFYLQINRLAEGEPGGAVSMSIDELIDAFRAHLDFEHSRAISEATLDRYKDGSNPSIFYMGGFYDPLNTMEDHRDFILDLISKLKGSVESLESDLPRYEAWIDNQKKKRKIRKDWPPAHPPRSQD